jgi:hypothetical protein
MYSFFASSTASKNSFIPAPVIALTPTACNNNANLISVTPRWMITTLTDPQVRVKLIQHKTHARHQTVHVRRLAILIPAVCRQCTLEGLKVVHPVDGKVVRLGIGFVEDENEW